MREPDSATLSELVAGVMAEETDANGDRNETVRYRGQSALGDVFAVGDSLAGDRS